MARPPSDHPTDGELEILQVLWDQEPSSLSQICICTRLRSKRPVANTTVATMLKVMLDKDLVTRQPVQPDASAFGSHETTTQPHEPT